MKNKKQENHVLVSLQRARKRYAEEWGGGNAQQFATGGYYDWMAGFIEGARTVLEVGIGNGCSTFSMLNKGCTVIGIDENPACIEAAQKILTEQGKAGNAEMRGSVAPGQGAYSINYQKPRSPFPQQGFLLLEGDVMNDDSLFEWILGNGGVNAIACWLMGTYQERAFNAVVSDSGVKNPAAYRSVVQERICRLADRLLSAGGIVHIVDRCLLSPGQDDAEPGSPEWIEQCRSAYQSRASGSGLQVGEVELLSYLEPSESAGPSVKLTHSLAGEDPESSDKAFVSLVLRRP